MKRIAIFCDGTWNQKDAPAPTNIVKLYEAAAGVTVGADGVRQLSYYIPGVGVVGGGLGNLAKKYGGGAFGWGLDEKILQGYRFLIETYEPGDEVFVFGFSRGAYTARSLLGLIRNCGVPDSVDEERLTMAMGFYRSRAESYAPGVDRMRSIRAWLSPKVATDDLDLAQRPNPGQCHLLKISYLGLFDTVGALGVPGILSNLSKLFNRKYKFHDTKLSSMVSSARHALSIDDARVTYPPTLFDPVGLNALNSTFDPADLPYREAWFPGVHGTVGGGLLDHEGGLGNATLDWIAAGAEARGLGFDEALIGKWRGAIDHEGPLFTSAKKQGALDRLTVRLVPYFRKDTSEATGVSDAARLRWLSARNDTGWPYRPKTLEKRSKSFAAVD